MSGRYDALKFERLLSAKPKLVSHSPEPCLRDMIFHYYETAAGGIAVEYADKFTKEYIEKLWEVFNA